MIAVRAQDRATAVDDVGYLLTDDETTRAKPLGVLLELAADERPADLAVRRDVRTERIEPSRRNIDDLLRDAGEIGRLLGETGQLLRVVRAKHLHPEAVVEAALLRRLDDRGIADLFCHGLRVTQRVRPWDRDAEVMRVGVEPSLIEHRVDDRQLAEGDAVAGFELRAITSHRQDPFVIGREQHRALPEMPRVVEHVLDEAVLVLERIRALVSLADGARRLSQATRIRIQGDDVHAVCGQ